ncbi:MAG TPA: MobF family relaxase [Mycobacteriales bacterium]|nr:MobF family relaxase [Mycobacteriales bacterium]
MLSTAKVRTSSWRYYANQVGRGGCEYFLGIGEAPGRWYGRGLDRLGLEPGGEVREWQLEATFGRAVHPAGRYRLGRAWRADGVTGYDLCFSAPKSVSALWALGGGDIGAAIQAAHRAAVRAGLDYLDSHAGLSRAGRNGHTQVGTDGLAAAVFDHRTSRAGDPQLHTHALVLNKLHCPDGQWRTIDGYEIYTHKKSAGVLYQAALRCELTRRLGVTWAEVSKDGQAEIAGVPQTLCDRWSTRAGQVAVESAPVLAGYEAALGRPLTSAERSAVCKVAVLKTRPGKARVDIVGLVDRWHGEAGELGWTPDRLVTAVADTAGRAPHVAPDVDRLVLDAVAAAGARKAVFTRSDLAVEVAARIPADAAVDAATVTDWVERLTDRALTLEQTVTLLPERDGCGRRSDARYASAVTLGQELAIIRFAEAGRRAGVAICPHPTVERACGQHQLDPAQARAVHWITRAGEQLSVLVAPAGTGKTTTLAAIIDAWQNTGRQVIALAPSARAAKELTAATGLPADTVAKYLHANSTGRWPVDPRYRLRRGAVLIVDEASMLATADLHALKREVETVGGKLLLVGDPAQIGAIDAAGGMLPALADRLDAPTLTTVHRLRERWEQVATLQLRAGDPTCIPAYLAHDRVHPVHPDTDPYDAVLDEYERLTGAGARVLLLARSHDDVDQLNARARARAIEHGEIRGDPLLAAGGYQWRVGDRMRVTRNNRRIPVGADHLRNGDLFTVTGHTPHGLTVRRLHGPDTTLLPRDYLARHATYGWASTIDAAQGATVDHSLTLARPGLDRTRLYVALTRGRESNRLYLALEPDPEITSANTTRAAPDAAAQFARLLNHNSAHDAAHTRLPEPIQPTRSLEPATRASSRISRRPLASERFGYREPDPHRPLTAERDHGRGVSR